MSPSSIVNRRIKYTFFLIVLILIVIIGRLFYWQVFKANNLSNAGQQQNANYRTISGQRGKIYTADNQLLVGNKTVYNLYVNKNELEQDQLDLINQVVEIFDSYYQNRKELSLELPFITETDEAGFSFDPDHCQQQLTDIMSRQNSWLKLASNIPLDLKSEIESASLTGLHLLETSTRHYPEGSMAAHITGFVGKNKLQEDVGYFGIEGGSDKELQGQEQTIDQGSFSMSSSWQQLNSENLDGRNLTLTIRRDIQFIADQILKQGVEKTGSKSGELAIMDPGTGAILALATWPHYDPALYQHAQTEDFKNPALTSLFEPGSTFKIYTMSAGLDLGVITPQTECDKCDGPRVFGEYTIRTWNEQYHPNINMTEALRLSDNTALVFVAEKIGSEKFINYFQKFGFGQAIDLDLQEDRATPTKKYYRPVELANAGFGQGFYVNTLQMLRATSVIANQGKMMRPYIVHQVTDVQTEHTITHQPELVRQVIKPETADQITKMMIHAAPERDNWINQHYSVAGKTGTAQIAGPGGGYQDTGVISSYVGFAPADDPQFAMIVKLVEPGISPWAEVTAAPIWYDVADKIMLLL